MSRLVGKRAIVTGGGSGIGHAACLKLAAEGAKVAVLDVDETKAAETTSLIEQSGGSALALPCDVAIEDQVAAAVGRAAAAFGGLDTIVANAGVMLMGQDRRADQLELSVWQHSLDVNLTGLFLTCKHGLRALLANKGGSVVITSSPTGVLGCAPTFTAYSSSKAGSLGLMRILAADYAKDNIRVNAVFPGTTASPLVTQILSEPNRRDEFLARIPLGRPAEPEEIANVIAFLASDEAAYVHGAAWFADGGLSAI